MASSPLFLVNILKLVVATVCGHHVSRVNFGTSTFPRQLRIFPTATMSSILLRSLARTARTTTASRLLRRNLTASTVARQESQVEDGNGKTGFDYHTVEDYHGMSAHEILSGPKEDAKFRHFTGEFVWSIEGDG